ncbi:glutamate racemase [Salinisphaera sp.]|uniref:glutamate racemase n=1 Tax=Salinisphaera sp. TaxID=1914330 RepID=UPI002D794FAC|nr:glutamate racemase [Salinisphaera sp.]HET7312906.1 glutamate racemase [Salinisphaera sp.]
MPLSVHATHAPILIFDSGVGGLSVLAAVRAQLPRAPLVYAMDGAAYPYGQRSDAELTARVPALLGRLVERYRPRLVIIACNTASTIALAAVRDVLAVPVVGTVPAIKPAAERSISRVIGVLGTRATVRQRYVDELARRFAADCRVLRHGAPALVDHVESALRGEPSPAPEAPRKALAGLLEQPGGDVLDTVVLACTHFPLALDALRHAAPAGVGFVDGADGIARRCAGLLAGQRWPPDAGTGVTITTGEIAACTGLAAGLGRFGLAPAIAL